MTNDSIHDPILAIEQTKASAFAELQAVADANSLEAFRIKYLGTKGLLKDLMNLLKTAPADQKKQVGQSVNAAKQELEAAFEARLQAVASDPQNAKDAIDVTEPGTRPSVGSFHVVSKVTDELVQLFARLGFTTAQGPELEDDWHNFVALNIPDTHPARDPNDNFYLAEQTARLLRTQTSTVQIRVMENQKPPIRVVIPGRVYRPDTIDATHLPMFHQLEALVVEEGVTMIDLKSTVLQFVKAYFGQDTKIRFRASFFPFTEPSAEVDVWFEDKQKWIELGGCGMVHPNVLKNCKIDPEVYSGWAFGFGIERIAMRKYAIPDIRLLVENDLRFLRQF
jgi:phenylalanyl-tRNA synthetase alpha chain